MVECRTDGAALPAGNRSGYVGTATIADIDTAKNICLIGTNPRVEAPVLNARLRKVWLTGATIRVIGEAVDFTYPITHLGTGRDTLAKLADGPVDEAISGAPSLVIVGQRALLAADGAAVRGTAMRSTWVWRPGRFHGRG